ncbi:MAG: DUF5667 domain-containing protein [Nocardioidaceae bacterium]
MLHLTRRRAEELARAIDGRDALVEPRLQPLLDAVSRLAAVPIVEPRAEFRDNLRSRLLEAAAVELRGTEAGAEAGTGEPRHRDLVVDDAHARARRRRLVAVATGLVLAGGSTSVAAASQQSLPGEMLYPLKRALEAAEVTMADGLAREGRELLERASTRLVEAESLTRREPLGQTEVDSVETALGDFRGDASDGGQALLDSYAASGDAADLRAIREFTTRSQDTLSELAPTLPRESRPLLRAVAEALLGLDDRAVRACPDCTALPPLNLPASLVSLPTMDEDASPWARGREPLGVKGARPVRHRAEDQPAKQRSDRQNGTERRAGAQTDAPELPAGVDLVGPGVDQPADDPRATASPDGQGGDDGGRQPLVDTGDLRGGSPPSRSPQTVEQPDLRDVTEPLDPLLDEGGDAVDGLP